MTSLMVLNDSRLEGVTITDLHACPDSLTITFEYVADHGAWFCPADPLSGLDGWTRGLERIEGEGRIEALDREQFESFRALMTEAGFEVLPGSHPITPIMFPGEDGARQAAQIADAMLRRGVYVIAFSYPVVPQGKARIRVQLSAAHSDDDVRACVRAFEEARAALAERRPE